MEFQESEMMARYGYRPVRDPHGDGVRIEVEYLDGRPIIHNYGHGGAGVTLSWGSAARVGSLARECCSPEATAVEPPPEFAVAHQLQSLILEENGA